MAAGVADTEFLPFGNSRFWRCCDPKTICKTTVSTDSDTDEWLIINYWKIIKMHYFDIVFH